MSVLKIKNDSGEWQSITAIQGEKGETPVKGTDYWTAADKEEIVTETLNSLPLATTETAGKVKPDGTTITIDEDGTIHSAGSGSSTASDVSFDNTDTGLAATNVQSALVEINTDLVGSEEVQEMIDENMDSQKLKDAINAGLFRFSAGWSGWVGLTSSSYDKAIDLLRQGNSMYGKIPFHVMYFLAKFNNGKGYTYIAYCNTDGTIKLTNNPYSDIPDWSSSKDYYYIQANKEVVIVAPSITVMENCLSRRIPFTSTSGLTATNIPAAIDELATKINSLVDGNEVSY